MISRTISGVSGRYGTSVTRPRKAGRKCSSSSGRSAASSAAGVGGMSGSAHSGSIASVPGVRSHDDQRVLEVDVAPLAVLDPALVEHLVEDVLDAGMRLLHLVQQDDAVRPPPHRLGQHAALAVADVPRRRAEQHRHLMLLLELAHVDDGHRSAAAVERSASARAVSVLPTPDSPTIRNTPTGLLRVGQPARGRRASRCARPPAPAAGRRMRAPMIASKSRTRAISSATIRPTGMPVHAATTSATA